MSDTTTYPIRHRWSDGGTVLAVLSVLVMAALMLVLSACGPKEDTRVPTPRANAAPVAPSGQHTDNSDCHALSGDDLSMCGYVSSLPAYGWTNADGSKVSNPRGAVSVRELLSGTTDPEEITAGLSAMLSEYREHTRTTVLVDLTKLPDADCWYEVGYAPQHAGQPYKLRAQVDVICPTGDDDDPLVDKTPRYLQAAK